MWYCSCSFAFFIWNIKNQEQLSFYKEVAFCFSGFMAAIVVMVFQVQREEIARLLVALQTQNKIVLRRHKSAKKQKTSDQIFSVISVVWMIALTSGFPIVPMLMMEFFLHGDVYFKNIFFKLTPWSMEAIVTCIVQNVSLTWNIFACTTFLVMVFECFMRLSFFFGDNAQEIFLLRSEGGLNEEEEEKRLKELLEEYSFLQR